MPLWLYDLPNWLFGVLICLCWVAVGLLGHSLVQHLRPPRVEAGDMSLALAVVGVVATVNSLLLAFSAVSVWEAHGNAEQAVSGEANVIGELARDLAVFNTADSHAARSALKLYVKDVITKEWPAMRTEQTEDETWDSFDDTFRAVGRLQPATPREEALMPEIWARTNELIRYRRDRLEASRARVPDTLWGVVLFGTLLTLLPAYVMPRTRFNRFAIAILSLAMGLVFFFVAAMDRPFAGTESIDPGAFELSLKNMQRWDTVPGR